MKIKIFATGGTFDKIYYDAKNDFHIGEPMVASILEEANVTFDYAVDSILKKDSLNITDQDRELIRNKVERESCSKIILTHGSDTMIKTAMCLLDIKGKVIVITGAMQPARMRYSDAIFNIGVATAAVQTLSEGVYVAMNGRIFNPATTVKNVEQNRFEDSTI